MPAVATTSGERVRNGVESVRQSATLDRLARAGLVARGVFYLLLAYLGGHVAQTGAGGARQANANGALATVAT